jgi:hypothetical protein
MERSFENSTAGHSTGIIPSGRQRLAGAARLAAAHLMGRSSGAVLPRLDGTATEFRVAEEDNRAILLAKTLTALGFAEPEDWERAERRPSPYVLTTLKRWIAEHGGNIIRQWFAVYATISSTPDPYSDEDTRSNLLYFMVNPDSAGYVVMGPTLELLAAIHFRLPVSFYRLFMDALRRWIRVYDFEDAQEHVEMLREWAEGEEEPEQFEFPDVEDCTPARMKDKALEPEWVRLLAQEVKDDGVKRILSAAFKLGAVSRKVRPTAISEETREMFMDSNPPLPALLVSFKHHDAVAACFDEESQGMLEAVPEPNLIQEIDPADPASVQQAFDALAALCETMAAASQLMSLLPGNEGG